MLEIMNVDIPIKTIRMATFSHKWDRVGHLRACTSSEITRSLADCYRSPVDYLEQGGDMGLGNNAVDNVQVNGVIYPKTVINGVTGSGWQPNGNFHIMELSVPPSIKIGSYLYACLSLGSFHVRGWFDFSGKRYFVDWQVSEIRGDSQTTMINTSVYDVYANKPGKKLEYINTFHSVQCAGAAESDYPDLTYLEGLENPKRRPNFASDMVGAYEGLDALQSANQVAGALAYYAMCKRGVRTERSSAKITSVQTTSPARGDVEKWVKYLKDTAHHLSFPDAQLSSCARGMIEDLNAFDSNLLAYGADLKKTGDTIRTLLSLPKDFKNPKAWASAWLSGRYGDRLTVSDTRELLEAVVKEGTRGPQLARARSKMTTTETYGPVTVMTSRTATIIAADESYSGLMTAVKNLMAWDAWPTLENTWDMIPLSFVVDWVLPVSDVLGQIDACVEAPYIKPRCQYVGLKTTANMQIPAEDQTVSGSLSLKHYTRRKANILSEIRPFADDISLLPSFSVINAGDALALTLTLKGHR